MNLFEKTIDDKLIHKGAFLEYRSLTVELPDGNISKRDVLKHPGGVTIVAIKDDGKVLMVEQFRKPLDLVTLELPAGKIEKGEDLKLCAMRELEEETGFKSGEFNYVGKIVTSPGFCDEYIYIYKAEKLYKGNKGGDEDEFINVHEYSIDEIKKMIKNGELVDAKSIAAFMMIL